MTKYIHASAFALLLALGTACGGGDGGGGEEDSGVVADSGSGDVDAGQDAGPICIAPTDGTSLTFLNRGTCADSRVECEPFDATRIPTQP